MCGDKTRQGIPCTDIDVLVPAITHNQPILREPDVPGEIPSSVTDGKAKEKAGITDVLTVKATVADPLTVPAEALNGMV